MDEAYRLSEGGPSCTAMQLLHSALHISCLICAGERDFGVEAIETMMVEMTKPRSADSVVFAFAGCASCALRAKAHEQLCVAVRYKDKMEGFLRSNAGMHCLIN